MTRSVALMLFVLLLLFASDATRSQSSSCKGVQFSPDVLSRFPHAPDSCLDVITRDGQQFAVFKAQLDRVRGRTLHLRFKQPDGGRSPPVAISTQPGFRVLIDGQPTRVRDLASNQELTAYVRVDRPLMAIAPASEKEVLYVVPLIAPQVGSESPPLAAAPGPTMPNTAGPLPLVALLGSLFLLIALGLRIARARG
jgi:hypothetical protein